MIINSLLDTDFYKFKMMQWIRQYYPNGTAKFALINRSVKSMPFIAKIREEDLRRELDHAMSLLITREDQNVLKEYGIRSNLEGVGLTSYKLKVGYCGDYYLTFEGPWWQVTLWETIAMSIISELYWGNEPINDIYARAVKKKHMLEVMPDLVCSDFGTRRRYSHAWQSSILSSGHPCGIGGLLTGTSNVFFANKYNLKPIGTMAHEVFMGVAGLYDHAASSLRGSQQVVLKQWEDMFGSDECIMLTDTWGKDFFLEDMTDEQAIRWKGLRHDSGNPLDFGNSVITRYKRGMVSLRDKQIVFSDELDLPRMMLINEMFKDDFKPVFGWGTNLTCDIGLPRPSFVVKMVSINGNKVVKLSNTPGKTQGPLDKQMRYRRAFQHLVGVPDVRSTNIRDRAAVAPTPAHLNTGYKE